MMHPIDLIKIHARKPEDNPLRAEEDRFLSFHLGDVILNHRRFDHAMAAIAKLHHAQVTHKCGGGLLIYGPSGMGKTTITREYAKHFLAYTDGHQTVVPVLVVTCPSSATASGLMSAIFSALNYPIPSRSDIADKTLKVIKLLKMFKVELLVLDEFNHAYYSRSLADFRQLIDTLKVVISETRVASVLVGLSEGEQVIATNEQLARRHSESIEISLFDLNDEEDFKEFRAILRTYQEALIIPVETPLFEANLARRFLIASDGNLDYLRRVIEKSVQLAGLAGMTLLTNKVYAAAFREYVWREVPDKLNPFHENSPLRRLNKPGEPYYPWSQKHAIGSPLARRNIISVGSK